MLVSTTRCVTLNQGVFIVEPVALTKTLSHQFSSYLSSNGWQLFLGPATDLPWTEAARHWPEARPLGLVRYQGLFYSVCKQSRRYTGSL
jgi:hypothetical protein